MKACEIVWLLAGALVAGAVCGAELPYDCELDYLTVAKGVHFDTGLAITSAPAARVKFACPSLASAMDLFGTGKAEAGSFILNVDGAYMYYRYGTSSHGGKSSTALVANTVYDYTCGATITSGGATIYSATFASTWNSSSPLSIPGRRYAGPLTIYAFSLEMDGVTVFDYVPVVKEGQACLYDKISGTCLLPTGGVASAGPVKGNTTQALVYDADAVNANDYDDVTLTVDVAQGATVTFSGNLTGNTRLVKTGAGTLIMTGTGSDFSGGVELQGGILNTKTAQGYGVGGISINPENTMYSLQFEAPGACFSNNVTVAKSVFWNALGNHASHVQFLADTTYDGDVRSNCSDNRIHFGVTNKVTLTMNGDLLSDAASSVVLWAFGNMVMNGRVNCKYCNAVSTWSTEGTITFNNPSNRIAYYGENYPASSSGMFDTYSPVIRCGADNVVSNLLWRPCYRFNSAAYNLLDLNGHDQTIRGMTFTSADFASYVIPGFQMVDAIENLTTRGNAVYNDQHFTLQCTSAQPATLTLTGTGAGTKLVTPQAINGELSLVLDADATHETILSNRTHTMTGSIRVKKGTLNAIMGSSFANASAVKVDAGATFNLSTVATNALKSVKRFEIDGAFSFTSAAPQALAYADLAFGDDAVVTLPAGTYCMKSLTFGGTTYTSGTFGAGGTAIPQLSGSGVTFVVVDQVWPVVLAEPVYEFEVAAGATNQLNDATVKVTQGGSTKTVAFSTLEDPVSGTIVKKGAGVLMSSQRLKAFAGDVLIEAGGFAVNDNLQVGPQTTGATTVWVRNGASFIVWGTADTCGRSNLKLYHNLHLKGTGLNGLGAIDMETDMYQNYAFKAGTWKLDGDALISGRTTERVDLGSVIIDLNGYTLTRAHAGASCGQHVWSYVKQLSPGRIAVAGGSSLLIQAACEFCTSGTSEIVLTNGAALGYYNSSHTKTQNTKVWVQAGGNACKWSNGGSTTEANRMLPGDVKQGWWDGPVQVDGQLKVYGTCDYKGLAFRGKVSGSGELLLSSGWMHFYSPANDFDGAVAFTDAIDPSFASFVKGIAVYTNGALSVACRSVTVTNAPFALMNNTDFDLPALTYSVKADAEYSIYGGTGGTLAGLRKVGAGQLTLAAPLAVTGRLEVVEGTLKVDNGSGSLTVGTYVPGAGTLDGDVSITDRIVPGDASGRVTGTVTVEDDVTVSLDGRTLHGRTKILTADGGVAMTGRLPVAENPDLFLYARGDSLYVANLKGTAVILR